MASNQNQSANVDLFDAYFRRADLDRDGRISGVEAVAFFQGSGLSKQVLAQIWEIANQGRGGLLGRTEFYNALKLVTVAQSKRDLTPEIVKAALYGPASAKIPAPQISFGVSPAPQFSSSVAAPSPQIGPVNPVSPQNVGFRGSQVPTNVSGNQQNFPSQGNSIMTPSGITPNSASNLAPGVPTQGLSGGIAVAGVHPSISPNWVGGTAAGSSLGISGPVATSAALPPKPQPSSGMKPSGQLTTDSKAVNGPANGFSSDSFFGEDAFSAISSQPKKDSLPSVSSTGNTVNSSAATQHSVRPSGHNSMQSSFTTQPVAGQFQPLQPLMRPNQHGSLQASLISTPSKVAMRSQNSPSSQSSAPWPRMTQSDIQKYTKIFVEVDSDRDGKITGEQARNLFLNWRLPREVLKQVWDLSDQDNDSMLSLREFCVALYLMERYREGRSLPSMLPNSIMFDLPSTSQPTTPYGNAAWGSTSGIQQQQQIPGSGTRKANLPVSGRPPRPAVVSQFDEEPQQKQQKSKVPVLEKHLIDQLSSEEQNSLNSKFKEASEADKKVEELEKEILESKEKIEFYRTKMQELVLYKSRCDNRLNEITERVSADKRELETLAKKYEDKCRQVGDVASKLTAEEATFRDVQERKMELYQAIVKMEQDGSDDGKLQVHADRIQSDLDELVKSLNERCKKYGIRAKPSTLMELPFAWQPGIQEGAADWDENWDKFEDEGFTFVKELTLDVQNVLAPPKQKLPSDQRGESSFVESPKSAHSPKDGDKTSAVSPKDDDKTPRGSPKDDDNILAASPKDDDKSETPHGMEKQVVENGSTYKSSENESAKSAPDSLSARSDAGSPSRELPESDGNTVGDTSPHYEETQRNHGSAEAVFSGDKIFDEPKWGTFDTSDDIDSVWSFNSTKENDNYGIGDNYFFGSGDFGLNPIRTGSPQAGDPFQKRGGLSFDDSVPNTPLFSSSNSPQRSKEWPDLSFDSFPRGDSFSTQDSGFFPTRAPTRFDSTRSSRDFDQGHGFPSFDDSDPFGPGSSKTSVDSQTPRRGSDNWGGL